MEYKNVPPFGRTTQLLIAPRLLREFPVHPAYRRNVKEFVSVKQLSNNYIDPILE